MNRLLARSVSRALRVQRLAGAHITPQAAIPRPSLLTACRYASSSSPSPKYDRLLATLRPGMSEDTLAVTIAALYLSTRNQLRLTELNDLLKGYIKGHNLARLNKKVEQYMNNPPQDKIEALTAGIENQPGSPWEVLPDVGMATIVDGQAHLEGDKIMQVLERLEPEELEELNARWEQADASASSSADGSPKATLQPIIDFFSQRGMHIRVPNRLEEEMQEIEEQKVVVREEEAHSPGWIEEMRAIGIPELKIPKKYKPVSSEAAEIAKAKDQALEEHQRIYDPYPDLMTPDPMLDPRDVIEFPPNKRNPYHNRVIVRNHTSVFQDRDPEKEAAKLKVLFESEEGEAEDVESAEQDDKAGSNPTKSQFQKLLPVSSMVYSGMYQSILLRRAVVQQTGKGKIRRTAYIVLLGNGRGLVGYGEGKHANSGVALNAARINALRNMDWVERFEKRTVWTEMETKLGSTSIIIRPRPVGFGLRCNPWLHQILRAAGFKDISAKVWGSRNKLNVIKAAFRMLHAGHAPTGMGDGIGGKGSKLSKGIGMRSMNDLERARGRKLISLRK